MRRLQSAGSTCGHDQRGVDPVEVVVRGDARDRGPRMPSSASGGDRRRGDRGRRELDRLTNGRHRVRAGTDERAADRRRGRRRPRRRRSTRGTCVAAAPHRLRDRRMPQPRRSRHPLRLGTGAGRRFISSHSDTAATMPATVEGIQSSSPASARVIAATIPTAPNASITTRPHGGRHSSSRPAAAATRTSDDRDADEERGLVVRAEEGDRGILRPRRREVDERRADHGERARARRDDGRRQLAESGAENGGGHPRRGGGDARLVRVAGTRQDHGARAYAGCGGHRRRAAALQRARLLGATSAKHLRNTRPSRLMAWAICSTATAPHWRRARRRPGSPRSTRCSAVPTIRARPPSPVRPTASSIRRSRR